MNITAQRARPTNMTYSGQELLLASKLEAAATGVYPRTMPRMIYLTQAQGLLSNPALAGSVVASLMQVAE